MDATGTPSSAGTPRTAGTAGRPGRLRRLPALVLAVLLALLALAGCAAGDAASSEAGAADAEVAAEAPEARAAAPDEAGGPGDAGVAGDEAADDAGGSDAVGGGTGAEQQDGATSDVLAPASARSGRRVVTSSIDVAVEDVQAAAREVRALAGRLGGEVADESSQGGEQPRAEIVLRVPAGGTAEFLEEVAGLGEEVARSADAEPVETRLVDLQSRTDTQRAGVERIRALLEQATTLEDILALEAELTRRQADLESVDAQRAALADLAALATVTVRLTTPGDVVEPEPELPPFLSGLDAGWEALVASTTVVLVVLGGLLPFAVVLAVGAALALAVVRALRSRRPTQVPPAQVAPAPPVAAAPTHEPVTVGAGPLGAGPDETRPPAS